MEEKISIIIPAYNVEKTLGKCLDSVLSQTYTNLEIIIINDGSVDGTQDIIDSYASKDSRIIKLYQENAGLSMARNAGLSLCSSELVTFLDSDDWIEADTIEFLYKNLKSENADISICGIYKDFANEVIRIFENDDITVYDRKQALEKILYDDEIQSFSWGKLYKLELFNGLKFPMGRIYEDYAFTYLLFDKAEKIVKNNTPKYHYVQYTSSLSNNTNYKKEYHLLLGAFERYIFAINHSDIISNWQNFNNHNAKLLFSIIKHIIRLSNKNEIKEIFKDILIKVNHFVEIGSQGVKWYHLLKLKTLLKFPNIYSYFLRISKKRKKRKHILH